MNAEGDVAWTVGYASSSYTVNHDLNLGEETWVHLTCVFDHTVNNKIYVNGVEAASGTPGVPGFGGTSRTPNLARGHSSPYCSPFRGNIAAFQLYHKVLSPDEVERNYRSLAYRFGMENAATTDDAIDLDAYTHIAAKKEGGTCTIYLNGTPSTSFPCTFAETLGGTLRIGGRASGVRESFAGVIDEVMIYDRALGVGEIEEIYQAGRQGSAAEIPEGLIGYWPLDTDWADHSGQGNNGTPQGNVYLE